jgi:hypothetical protein
MKLMIRKRPPHLGQASGSAAQTLGISRAQARLQPRLFAVNGHPDFVSNIGRAVAEGLLALHIPL